jgi:RNA-directed DNA polymerase
LSFLEPLREADSLRDVARILGYKPAALAYVLYKLPNDTKYTKFKIPKRGGGEREIAAPIEPLKTLQRRLANVLYACFDQIEDGRKARPLSHGFRKGYSIVTNAKRHRRRRYVLNIDLKDFFPSLNFGRVRGFFISNNNFRLNEKAATVIAQIACHDNALPQGSPCSPVISNLLAHLLDVRLAQISKRHHLTYSRYADDITFSTNKKTFPASIAKQTSTDNPKWNLGKELLDVINRAGFFVNDSKTRMQYRTSRQVVTGLLVNKKVNIRSEYYDSARSMCHSLFKSGLYYRPVKSVAEDEGGKSSKAEGPAVISSLSTLEGILSHIHYVKDIVDDRKLIEKKKNPTAARRLYKRFLAYRMFVRLEKPLVVCEGKTDNIYLKQAIKRLRKFHPRLGFKLGVNFNHTLAFFNYTNQAHDIIDIGGGAGDLGFFFVKSGYKRIVDSFAHQPLKHPVIVLIDNDDGAKKIFNIIKENYSKTISINSTDTFYFITDNLYLIKTPEFGGAMSRIESLFPKVVLETKLSGKSFNPDKDQDSETEYGKFIFADKVVNANAGKIDFSGFDPLLNRIVSVLDDYKPPK